MISSTECLGIIDGRIWNAKVVNVSASGATQPPSYDSVAGSSSTALESPENTDQHSKTNPCAPPLAAFTHSPQRDTVQVTEQNADALSLSDTRKAMAPSPSNAVRDFLERLKRPLVQLQDAFKEFGVVSTQDLDILCQLQDQWDFLWDYLIDRHDVTRLQWMIVRAGLAAYATEVHA